MLRLPEEEAQKNLARRIIREGLTARAVERLTARWGKKTPDKAAGAGGDDALFRQEVQERLQRYLGTRVRLQNRKKSGAIEIAFYGDEDLERLTALILSPAGERT